MTSRDKQISKLTDELANDIDMSGRDKVALLKALMIDKRAEEKNALELAKFQFIEEHRQLLTNESPGPNWMDGPQGLGRRLLDCDEPRETVDASTG